MNNPFDYSPDPACDAAFASFMEMIELMKASDNPEDINFCNQLEAGKMIGVLIAADCNGERHTLFAFSGQLGKYGFYYPGFVGPVFDYLDPEGYFKTKEKDISTQNLEIERYEAGPLVKLKEDFSYKKRELEAEIEAFKEACRVSKSARSERREKGGLDEEELKKMIKQSQFEKAELHRLKKRCAEELKPYEAALKTGEAHLKSLKAKRHAESEQLHQWLFANFRLLNARGEYRSLKDIFKDTAIGIPPSGAGECCAPKLLQAAYLRGWKPIAIAEYWYGKSKEGELRIHGSHYPACRGKCLPVLSWMLRGLEVDPPLGDTQLKSVTGSPKIVFENEWFCVVEKPAGMLSVPGKGNVMSVQSWLEEKYGADKQVKPVHRLDRDTSGLILATFGADSYRLMQKLFAQRKVKKTYIADLEGDHRALAVPEKGEISLPISPDFLDRPRQTVDFQNGKEAVSLYEFKEVACNKSRVIFNPLTGRTHQLRVHAASPLGLNMPICGDPLYAPAAGKNAERLHLHAHKIEFDFPVDGKRYSFESPVPFPLIQHPTLGKGVCCICPVATSAQHLDNILHT
ncbi:MAG: RNA pseudouridine synthase [Bacteroides sp.]|nr:RNA pseudouridine synthase [Bacteroides sp.]